MAEEKRSAKAATGSSRIGPEVLVTLSVLRMQLRKAHPGEFPSVSSVIEWLIEQCADLPEVRKARKILEED